MIVGLCGKAGSGKDEVAKILTRERGYTRVAFADAIKDIAYSIDPYLYAETRLSELVDRPGWEWTKNNVPEARRFLQRLGVAVRAWDEDFWVRVALNNAEQYSRIVITDVRFINEAEAIEKAGGHVYRVERSGAGLIGENAQHISETALADWTFPVIHNDGSLGDLERTVLGMFR